MPTSIPLSMQACRVLEAEYITSVHKAAQLPQSALPEVAFLGRSNVGKSSLLNALVQRKNLAHVGKTPGKTRAINYFRVKFYTPLNVAAVCYFVDLPGYGYAKVSKDEKKNWQQTIQTYISSRQQLHSVVMLLDCRREWQAEEEWLFSQFEDLARIVVLTKCDKLKRGGRSARVKQVQTLVGEHVPVFETALVGKAKGGHAELREHVLLNLSALLTELSPE